DFKTGAIAAGAAEGLTGIANENVGKYLDSRFVTDDQFRVATAQIVGIAAGSLVNGDPDDAAWVAGNVERYNEQLHPRAVELIKKEAAQFAVDTHISQEDAEQRLAQAAVYYTDKNLNGVMTENGTVPDETTLKYLGTALAPMAGQYAAPTASDVPTTQAERVYTPAETSTLLNQFADTNPARYADTSINSINFQGAYTGDLTYDYARFYDRNIAVPYDLGNTASGGFSGTWQGTKAAISNTVNSAWSLLSSPLQSSEQLANGVMSLTKNPLASAWNSLEPAQSKEGLATAYQMQGNNEAAAAIRNQGNVEFGLNLIPVERVVSLGKLGAVAKTTDDFYIERLLAEKGPCCFAAGTKVSTPSGDRAIESLKVGDVVWSKPEKGGKPFAAKILATHQRSDQPIYRLKLKSVRADGTASGETLLVTPSHPFYVPAKRDFIPVINLKPGDLLQSLADGDSENT
ncbi:Hint domain-containing protein, partial [Pseudomonas syringae group genomosp. 3]|uniref:Hint domain-containing protein n=1 Tax=Pseudomonas syringae group genomosp. 3 TaxID=251701 RepID=UPI00157BABFE